MKYAFAAIALAALARAQTRDDIPECAIPCLDDAIKSNTDCEVSDTACVCGKFEAIRKDASTCIVDACGVDVALNEVLPATALLCENPGSGDDEAPASSSAAAGTSEAAETSAAETSAAETVIISTSVAETTVVETKSSVVETSVEITIPVETPSFTIPVETPSFSTEVTTSTVVAIPENTTVAHPPSHSTPGAEEPPVESEPPAAGAAMVGSMGALAMLALGALAL
jgi:hypothetical protein